MSILHSPAESHWSKFHILFGDIRERYKRERDIRERDIRERDIRERDIREREI